MTRSFSEIIQIKIYLGFCVGIFYGGGSHSPRAGLTDCEQQTRRVVLWTSRVCNEEHLQQENNGCLDYRYYDVCT